MIQFGMPTLVENRTLEENVTLCSSLGLKFIELNMNFPEYQIEQLEQTDADEVFFVKLTKSAVAMKPNVDMELPYDGAKEMLLIDNVENRELPSSSATSTILPQQTALCLLPGA